MRFYTEHVFPRLCDLFLGRQFIARHRRELLAQAAGSVLEIGVGTGLNLPCYPPHVWRITTVDPNPGMNRLAQKRGRRTGLAIDQRILSGEQLPFAAESFDCVVSTFTLCSIERVAEAPGEIYRVLRPGGRYLFFEHGLSPDAGVQKWQRRLSWFEMRLGGGCRLIRNMRELVAEQPFASLDVREFYLEKTPPTHGYIYRGIAVK